MCQLELPYTIIRHLNDLTRPCRTCFYGIWAEISSSELPLYGALGRGEFIFPSRDLLTNPQRLIFYYQELKSNTNKLTVNYTYLYCPAPYISKTLHISRNYFNQRKNLFHKTPKILFSNCLLILNLYLNVRYENVNKILVNFEI